MKLAIFTTPRQTCPPKGYGGHERQADIVVRKLIEAGHTVDLYCGPGSTCPATRRFESPASFEMCEHDLLQILMREGHSQYDCVVDYSALHLTGQIPEIRSLSLMMGDDFRIWPHWAVKNRVYCSNALAENWDCSDFPILPNIICYSPDDIPFGEGGSHALYVGLIHHKKGLHVAAEACEIAKIPFKVYGYFRDDKDRQYLAECGNHLEFMGELKQEGRWEVFGGAKVFIHQTMVCDAGPIAPQEAMYAGTPVVASPHGGITDMIENGVNGYYAFTPQDIAERITDRIDRIDRKQVRKTIIAKTHPDDYIRELERLCKRVADGQCW